MAKSKKPKSWAEQLADLEDPAPKGWYESPISSRSNLYLAELDPEDDAGQFEEDNRSDSVGDDENLADAREHYISVGYMFRVQDRY